MKTYESISALIRALDEAPEQVPDGWAYIDRPLSELDLASVAVLGDREAMAMERVETPTGRVPKPMYETGMHSLLDIDTLKDVLESRREALPNATLEQLIAAIRHYVETDDFLD